MSLIVSDSAFDFKSYVASRRQLIEERLSLYLNPGEEPLQLWEAMRYSVLSGGKRLRALLCLAAGEAVSPENMPETEIEELLLPTAAAIEMVHAMSLIHDDLPCLDNDDMRRGKPTNHKVFGEAMALLAGDALLILANQILIERTPASISRSVVLDVSLELSKALGPAGMVGGQVDDMRFTGAESNLLSRDGATSGAGLGAATGAFGAAAGDTA
ncbi:MAG TPA: polyprenyl synthetase family protein, partial [Chroococcales cyanobacterium]